MDTPIPKVSERRDGAEDIDGKCNERVVDGGGRDLGYAECARG